MADSLQKRKRKLEQRKRNRMPPDSEQLEESLYELKTGSDRSAALVAGANLEASLAKLIEIGFENDDDVTLDRLHDREGPLSSFYSKIELAYAMGFISESDRRELHKFRKIRNIFAHRPGVIKFSSTEIDLLCKKLAPRDEVQENLLSHWDIAHEADRARFYFVSTTFHFEIQFANTAMEYLEDKIEELRRREKEGI